MFTSSFVYQLYSNVYLHFICIFYSMQCLLAFNSSKYIVYQYPVGFMFTSIYWLRCFPVFRLHTSYNVYSAFTSSNIFLHLHNSINVYQDCIALMFTSIRTILRWSSSRWSLHSCRRLAISRDVFPTFGINLSATCRHDCSWLILLSQFYQRKANIFLRKSSNEKGISQSLNSIVHIKYKFKFRNV